MSPKFLGNVNRFNLLENYIEILKKLRIELLHDPLITLLDIYSTKKEISFLRDIYIPRFITTLCTIAKIWKKNLNIQEQTDN